MQQLLIDDQLCICNLSFPYDKLWGRFYTL